MAMSLGSNAWENQNASANVSSIGWSLSVTTTGGTYDNTNRSYYRVYTDNYDTGNVSFKISKTTTLNFSGVTQDYAHNNDGSLGSKNVHFILYDNVNNKTYTNDITVNFTKYNRYPSFTTNPYLVSKTETSVTFDFGGVDMASDLYYSTNNSTWTHASTFRPTITGLSPNTSYTIYCQARNQSDNSLRTTKTISVTTYDYPYCNSSSNFIIENNINISLNNPLNRTVTINIYGNDNSLICTSSRNNNGNISIGSTSSEIIAQYNSIPNSASGTYKVSVVYGSITKTRNNAGTYSVNTETSKPTFNLFDYEDINSTTLALTGNNQTCVLGYSTIQATVSTSNKATANNSATMSKYRLTIGSTTSEVNYSDSEAVTMQIANATSSSYTVYAIDSRGLSTDVTLTSPIQIPYTNIVKDVSNSSALRDGGVSEFVTLTLNGSIWVGNFGQVDNAIQNVTYRFKKSSDTTWTTGVTSIVPTLNQDGTFTFNGLIAGDNLNNGFDIDSVYNIEVIVNDKLTSSTYTFTLGSGTPHIAYSKNGISIMGKYDEQAGGELQIKGVPINASLPTGSISIYSGSTAPTGWLICDGSTISRTIYSKLFSVIGTTYGTGDGSTTFNIPNLKGKVPVGKDNSQTEFDNLGETGGEKTHAITVNEMPSHNHTGISLSDATLTAFNSGSQSGYKIDSSYSTGINRSSNNFSTGYKGGSKAHNNLQPYIVMNYIIKI